MLGWEKVIKRFQANFVLRWNLLKSVRRTVTWILLFILGILFLSIRLYPSWMESNKSILTVIALSIVGVMGLLSNFIQVFVEVISSYQKAEKSYRAFQRVTGTSKKTLRPKLRGIPRFFPRDETQIVLSFVQKSTPVILTGEAGAGKSAIAVELIEKAADKNMFCLLIDAKNLARAENANNLRSYFDIEESFYEAIYTLGQFVPIMIVIDQIDSVVGTLSCDLIIELLTTCTTYNGISVVAVSRYREANEQGAIRPLLENGFDHVVCQPVTNELVEQVLGQLGLYEIPETLFEIANNFLNLDIVCEIIRSSGIQVVANIQNEIDLWEKYRLILLEREKSVGHQGEEYIVEAVRLARLGLLSPDRGFDIDYPQNPIQSRLISGNVIRKLSGRRYQFGHDKLQDYLYSWDACERNKMPNDVENEIGELHARNVIIWMRDIYHRSNPHLYAIFLEEALDG